LETLEELFPILLWVWGLLEAVATLEAPRNTAAGPQEEATESLVARESPESVSALALPLEFETEESPLTQFAFVALLQE